MKEKIKNWLKENWLFRTIMTIIAVFFLILFIFEPYIGDIETWFNKRKYYNTVSEIASKQLEGMWYGKDAAVNKMIAFQAEAENWIFSGQEGFALIKTGDLDVPFVTSALFIFTDPNDENRRHILRNTYIFHNNYDAWVPLSSHLMEFFKGKGKSVSRYVMWQGDYEIPFFK
ncbi:MAG: hypothetical protein AAB757_00685 [Patescibacteria group bacterium]